MCGENAAKALHHCYGESSLLKDVAWDDRGCKCSFFRSRLPAFAEDAPERACTHRNRDPHVRTSRSWSRCVKIAIPSGMRDCTAVRQAKPPHTGMPPTITLLPDMEVRYATQAPITVSCKAYLVGP